MRILHLTVLFFVMNFFSAGPALRIPSSSKKVPTNIILQSKDGGLTFQDITVGLPDHVQPDEFFAGPSDIYFRADKVMYHSKSNLETPVWEKETGLGPKNWSMAFNRSGVTAYNYEGQVYKKSASGAWEPVCTSLNKNLLRTIFETPDGTLFIGSDHGLFKSVDKGQRWKQVQNEGWVMEMAEAEGVLVATGEKGIMRSTDRGEHWEWVISEGGVGIAIERIEGGFAAISYNTKVKSRRIHTSMDGGKTWTAIDYMLRSSLSITSIKQLGGYLIVGHPDGIFRSSDMGRVWNMVHSGVENEFRFATTKNVVDSNDENKSVFKLYVSGGILYAVAINGGC